LLLNKSQCAGQSHNMSALNGKTVILGASPNPVRFSHKAVKSLLRHEKEVVAVGFRGGLIAEEEILVGTPKIDNVHTVSIYIGSSRQTEFYDYIISLKPQRVIFNPGTVNPEFMGMLKNNGIEPVSACMLVMLSEGEF
jgi:predicted CoA-binding protein